MRRILRYFVIDMFALYVVSNVAVGMEFNGGWKTFLLTGLVLTVITILGKPVMKILLLPLNLITFGLFNWVGNAIGLYIVTLIVDGFRVEGFYYVGLTSKWLDVPELTLSGPLAFIAFSFLLSFITGFLHWLFK
ncbi:phage holin family protein [Patescibacteria group bacterium]